MIVHPRPKPLLCTAAALLLSTGVVLVGCSRGVYRRQADHDAYAITGERAKQLKSTTDTRKWAITPKEDSRLYDATNPDEPPMPVDDPIAAELNFAHKEKKSGVPESEAWRHYLPGSATGGVLLDSRSAVLVAARNSRDFQRAREELFLAALDVTEERHRFDPNFQAGTSGTTASEGAFRARTLDGAPAYTGSLLSNASVSLVTAYGGEILAGFANTLLWDFGQSGVETAGSLLNFSVVQPLMRFAGRA
ncbi:MAG TPA: hypothetical protein VFG14_18205, partial [Chthoniobacteraceae bacterium]|nr:hypothetical protein [Chthoniobacteraceae bacterium]